jgi:hypothetical protein
MKKLDKKQLSQILESTLLDAGKEINSTDFASQTAEIINNEQDFNILIDFVKGKTIPSMLEKREIRLKYTLLATLQDALSRTKADSDLLSNDFIEIFEKDSKKAFYNQQLDFAMNQFCVAFYEYKELEKKYPLVLKGFSK